MCDQPPKKECVYRDGEKVILNDPPVNHRRASRQAVVLYRVPHSTCYAVETWDGRQRLVFDESYMARMP